VPSETPETTPDVPERVERTPAVETPTSTPEMVRQVLGASRAKISASQGAVLGARRGLDCAVLGKRRRPTTGDSPAMLAWIVVMAMAFGNMITSTVMLMSSRKDRCRKKKS
jgi:hypothetical protein